MNYYKAIVIELYEKVAVVMDYGGDLHYIQRKEGMAVGQTIYYVEDDRVDDQVTREEIEAETDNPSTAPPSRTGRKKGKILHWRRPARIIAAVACFLLICLSAGVYDQSQVVQAAISMGSDRAYQLELNKRGRVMRVRDEKGDRIEDSPYQGKTMAEVDELLKTELPDENREDMVVTTATKRTDQSENLKSEVLSGLEANEDEKNIIYVDGQFDNYSKSLDARASFAAYELEQQGIQLWDEDEELTAEEKQDRLGDRALFVQVGEDKVAERREEEKRKAEEERKDQEEQGDEDREERRDQGNPGDEGPRRDDREESSSPNPSSSPRVEGGSSPETPSDDGPSRQTAPSGGSGGSGNTGGSTPAPSPQPSAPAPSRDDDWDDDRDDIYERDDDHDDGGGQVYRSYTPYSYGGGDDDDDDDGEDNDDDDDD